MGKQNRKAAGGEGSALGIVETRGMTGAIVASDAMAKRADIEIGGIAKVDAGIVTVTIRGDIGAVAEAVAAGGEAARKVGELRGTHVIPRPYGALDALLPRPISKS